MSSITIRNLDEGLKASLRLRAARHGFGRAIRSTIGDFGCIDDFRVRSDESGSGAFRGRKTRPQQRDRCGSGDERGRQRGGSLCGS